ncbi:adhesion G protein-coupled receptor E4-like isoform X2 [Dreissena polymorpha]|uniref:adhesion G protein-coupled receptor E4-like isoform X2 n=1 Tax=Dreissena polymorpha TaxID=45954 RepID=UPI002263DBED|nr:adhesion G protein-coupled receptor E4-like isoform X2 [Dreissena polymorpha]
MKTNLVASLTYVICLVAATAQETICEMKDHTFSCPTGQVLYITNVLWGRLPPAPSTLCNPFNTSVVGANCKGGPTALQYVQKLCEGQPTCLVQNDWQQLGPDPCTGVPKYLQVSYMCAVPTTTTLTTQPMNSTTTTATTPTTTASTTPTTTVMMTTKVQTTTTPTTPQPTTPAPTPQVTQPNLPPECRALTHFGNLTIELAPNTSTVIVNTTARFSCSTGTTLIGYTLIKCMPDGKWTGPEPKCIALQTTAKHCSINVDTKHRTWNETQPGAIAVEDCPIGYSGLVSRQCSEEGNWLNPFYNCISKIVAELIATVEGIKQSPSAEKIGESLEQLVNVTKPANGSSYIGELNAITDMLETLASISNVNEVTDKQANSFFAATSNLIDTDNTDSWQSDGSNLGNNGSLDGNKASTGSFGAMKVVNVVNKYTEVLLSSLENKHESSKTIQSDNLVVHVEKVNVTAADLKFPEEPLEISSSIILPKSSLNGSKSISAVVYKSLTGLVSSKLKNYSDTTINSEVVTVTVDNWEKNADFVVDITLEYAQDLRSAPICSFWNETIFAWDTIGCRVLSSNHSSATCRCTHLTNFAILMSPVIQSNVNTKELDIISIVGCSISLAGLMLTAICHVCLWKYISKRRAAVLLNLSVALIISYVMFIGGIDKTENKILCKALASLLHYIYLVVFSLMLVEGIDLAVSVLNVFKNRLKLKRMLTAAWVAPAVIVGITLGVTKTQGYGNEQSCWLTIKGGVIWAFVGPALLVILVNCVTIVIAIRTTLGLYAIARKSTVERSKSAIRCLLVLLPLMGTTWVLGVFYLDESMVWVQYAFAVCNSLQGLVIFLFRCAFDKKIWKAYYTKQQRLSTASRNVLKSRSTSVTSVMTENSEVNMTAQDTYEDNGQFNNQQQQTKT